MASRTAKFRAQLIWENGKRCAICGKKITSLDDLTVDHIVPLARGGKNVIENCQLAHKKCNEAKNDIMPDVYARLMKYNRRRKLQMRVRQFGRKMI